MKPVIEILHAQRSWFRVPMAVALVATASLTLQGSPGSATTAPRDSQAPAGQLNGAAPKAPVNKNATFVHIYSASVENLAVDCNKAHASDWQRLVNKMNLGSSTPDILVVEQINNHQLATLLSYMTQQLNGKYAGRMATTHLKRIKRPDCTRKKFQGNAIIWRTGRFTVQHHKTWQAMRSTNGGPCFVSKQVRTINQVIKFHDTKGHYLSVSSMHLPTSKLGGPKCAWKNIQRAHRALQADPFGGALRVIAGDTNTHDVDSNNARQSWYSFARGGKRRYNDAIDAACNVQNMPTFNRSCLNENWTFQKPHQDVRYDYIFARQGKLHEAVITDASTVAFDTGAAYSQHRAIEALIHYPAG